MLRKKKQEIVEERKVKVAESTINLITKELLKKLGIVLPLNEDSADKLAEYFELEEISLSQDQDSQILYDKQYMENVCRAVDDFYPIGDNETLDIDDLNARLMSII